MKVSFYNIGCKVNFAEMSQIQEQFEDKGYDIVNFGEPSEIVLINTCTVTQHADADCRKVIRRARKISPNAFIGVMGCYSQINPGEITAIEGVDAIFGIEEKYHIPEYFASNLIKLSKKEQPDILVTDTTNIPFHSASSFDNESRTRVMLKLQDGCDYYCSYCIIPYARGASRSMPFNDLQETIIKLENSDYYEAVLSGINLGDYKASTGEKFVDVIRFISQLEKTASKKIRFRISSIEPNLLTNEMLRIIKSTKNICHHFHIPLQSGASYILKLMQRRYSVDKFKDLISEIKNQMPDCCIGVDIITGFPGETDSHFQETYQLLESLPISYLHVFTYSERKGTKAYDLPGKIDASIRKERTKILRVLSDLKKKEFYRRQIGRKNTVIPEEFHPKENCWYGWTDNYIRVKFNGIDNLKKEPIEVMLEKQEGEFVNARII